MIIECSYPPKPNRTHYETYSFYMNIYYYSVAFNFTVTSMNGTGPGRWISLFFIRYRLLIFKIKIRRTTESQITELYTRFYQMSLEPFACHQTETITFVQSAKPIIMARTSMSFIAWKDLRMMGSKTTPMVLYLYQANLPVVLAAWTSLPISFVFWCANFYRRPFFSYLFVCVHNVP